MSEGSGNNHNMDLFAMNEDDKNMMVDDNIGPVTECNLYIKNIDYDISDDVLYSVFSQIGDITSHHIVRDANNRSRGFGFM
jgi:polyadenylate-binding protein